MKPIGANIVQQAAFAPATAIANNCGKQGNLIAEKIYEGKGNFGYNGLTDEFTDLIKAGVIDPVMVTKSALINAASICKFAPHHSSHDHRQTGTKIQTTSCSMLWVEWVVWAAWAEWG